jgi:hypothetical protein
MAASLLVSACGGGDAAPPPPATAAATATGAVDTAAPTVTITDSVAGTTATGDITFTFTFSEDVGISFTADDVVVTGGTKGTFLRIGVTQATLVVTPTPNSVGTVALSVAAGVFKDLASNGSTGAVTAQRAFNTVIPVIRTALVTFDETTPPVFTGFGGAEDATIVADPAGGTNKVAKIVKSATAELWAGTTVSVCANSAISTLPFSATNKKVSARVWSPVANIPVRLKLEDAADAAKTVETEATVTTAAGWQTLTFDFATPATGTAALNLANTYNKASVFFDFGKTGAQVGSARTYYLDDLSFVGTSYTAACPAAGGGGAAAATALVTFDEATAPKLTDFGVNGAPPVIAADPAGGSNKVLKLFKFLLPAPGSEQWAGVTVSTGANDSIPKIPFTATAKTMTLRVYSPAVGVRVRLKVEDAANNGVTCETDAITTMAGAWETLTFNFANPGLSPPVGGGPTSALDITKNYTKASIFMDFGIGNGGSGPLPADRVYYVDDLSFVGAAATGGGGGTATTTAITFDETTAPTFTGFGGAEDSTIATDPAGGTNKVAKIVKSGTAELWAGTTISNLANQAIAPIGFSATSKVITARVWSPNAGIPVRMKVENAADASKTVETEATVTVASGWQTLSFNFANQAAGTAALDLAVTYNKVSVFFNFGTTGATAGAKTYYLDDLTYPAAAAAGGGGATGGGGTLTNGIFADDYVGTLPATAKSTLGGDVGFVFDARLANGVGAAYDYGGVSGTAQDPAGVHNFYYGLGLNAPAITNAYFLGYIKSPNNGTVNVAGYTSIKVNVWGPDQLFKAGTFPALSVILQGPAVAGCGSNSGASEVETTFNTTAQGAGQVYTLPLSGFTLKFACSGETTVAQVLASIAQFNVVLKNTGIQYINKDPNGVAFTNGLNIGSIKFQ